MNIATIEEIAYMLKEAKTAGLPQPIVFLGAGASKTGGVPLAGEIVKDILEKYKHSPRIKTLKEDSKTYSKLMEYLLPFERNKLLKEYIDQAKINVTHIYLAQLLIEGYVDYVLTVNFDNLMLRALSLFNNFPATYDMAVLKDLTTTRFKEKSVVYLHGQHHGLWLLNTAEEMAKVREVIPPILNSIKDQRPWIFIGYSGEDPIFEHILKLGRFDNGLFWVTYYDNEPNEIVKKSLFEKSSTDTFLVKGYDSDSFMLKLNSELKLTQPPIIEKPFSSLKSILENIVDIDDKEHFKGVKERLEIVKNYVNQTIQQFEKRTVDELSHMPQELLIDSVKQQIIDIIIKENFITEEIELLQRQVDKLNNEEVNNLMSNLYGTWGRKLSELSRDQNDDETLLVSGIDKFNKAIILNPDDDSILTNWGLSLTELAKLRNDKELFNRGIEKCKRATEINATDPILFYNWGAAISGLAEFEENPNIHEESFEKYSKAIQLNPNDNDSYYNWGLGLVRLARHKSNASMIEEAFKKFNKASLLNPNDSETFNAWGNAINVLIELDSHEELYEEGFKKYHRAAQLNPKEFTIFYNWACSLSNLAKLKSSKELYKQSFKKFDKAIELNNKKSYVFNYYGGAISDLAELESDLELFETSIEKYMIAKELNSNDDTIYYNWGNAILNIAKLKQDNNLLLKAEEVLIEGVELGGSTYNLSCCYSLMQQKEKALQMLEMALQKNEITSKEVLEDPDWKEYLEDVDFINFIEKYKTA